MKTLYFLRHAKAITGDALADDHERPLNERGVRDAQMIGEYMREQGIFPARVLCSTALRTRQTLRIIEEVSQHPFATEFVARLYLASPKELLHELTALPESCRSVLIVGHNPTMHQLCVDLVGAGDEALLDSLAQSYPTGTLAEIDYPATDWAEIGPSRGHLKRLVAPKTLLTEPA